MSKVVFFSIPAHGHTNPTIEVVRILTKRGHQVHYYSFFEFQSKIEAAGAQFISCDAYMPPVPDDLEQRQRYDFASLLDMVTKVTIVMEDKVCTELKEFQPDYIISDSICIWGKLFAKKLHIPMICSTTTFVFNDQTAKLMKPGFKELFYMITGMPRIQKCVKLLQQHGYEITNMLQLIANDNDTPTIVYTSRLFQPMGGTIGDNFIFIGPSMPKIPPMTHKKRRPLIYISLGTVNANVKFYQECIKAFGKASCEVIMSVVDDKNISLLKEIPPNFLVKGRVNQLEVLQQADIFITHCGMNSVNESLWFEVPMVLVPQHSEQGAVAQRVHEIGAGILLKKRKAVDLNAAVSEILKHKDRYRKAVHHIAKSFREAGGAQKVAEWIEQQSSK